VTAQQSKPIPDGLIEYLRTVDTPTLSNAVEELSVRPRTEGFAPLSIRCLFPEFGRMTGFAVTAQVETMTQMGTRAAPRFHELFEAIHKCPKPAIVVLQEIGAHRDYAAHTGEIMATISQRLGAIGIVSDCGVRDIPEVRALKMHYFARGAVASHAHYRVVAAGEPVQIEGMVVQPGDVLHGDENGLMVVPNCDWEALKKAVDKVRSTERALLEYVRGDTFTMDGLRQRFLH